MYVLEKVSVMRDPFLTFGQNIELSECKLLMSLLDQKPNKLFNWPKNPPKQFLAIIWLGCFISMILQLENNLLYL